MWRFLFLFLCFSIFLETEMSELITAETKDFQDNFERERERLAGEIMAEIQRNFLKDEYQLLNELRSSLMNHSRFIENLFDETNPENVWRVEIQEKFGEVQSKADMMSRKVEDLESFLQQSGSCGHLRVGSLKAEMESLKQKVDGFVMQNLKIVNLLPRRIEALKRRLRRIEDKLHQNRKIKDEIL